MKLGINWDCYGGLDTQEQIALIKKNGFEATFLSDDGTSFDEVVPELRRAGIVCESIHAPFNGINSIWLEGEDGDRMLGRLLLCADACARNEIPVMVVHLSSGANPPRISETGYLRFSRLMEHAKSIGVTIAYENQRMLANLAFAFEQFPDAGFCWDVGHEACLSIKREMEYMPLFGDRLCMLHIHDNMRVLNADAHMIPYDGAIDFTRVARHIASSAYDGSVMLELLRKNSRFYDDCSPEDYYRRAAVAARSLERQIDILRSQK